LRCLKERSDVTSLKRLATMTGEILGPGTSGSVNISVRVFTFFLQAPAYEMRGVARLVLNRSACRSAQAAPLPNQRSGWCGDLNMAFS
jgi:hypothetical protein